MKFLVILAIATLTLNLPVLAKGFNEKTPWNEIFKTKQLILEFDEVIAGLELNNACLTNTEVRSIKDVPQCLELVEKIVTDSEGPSHSEYVCKSWTSVPRSIPRSQTKTTCKSWSKEFDGNKVCTEFHNVLTYVNDTIQVRVSKGYGTSTTWPGFIKFYTFPKCQ